MWEIMLERVHLEDRERNWKVVLSVWGKHFVTIFTSQNWLSIISNLGHLTVAVFKLPIPLSENWFISYWDSLAEEQFCCYLHLIFLCSCTHIQYVTISQMFWSRPSLSDYKNWLSSRLRWFSPAAVYVWFVFEEVVSV
jgi:hypothetical protein